MSKFAARTSAPIQKDYMNYMREETVDTAKNITKIQHLASEKAKMDKKRQNANNVSI